VRADILTEERDIAIQLATRLKGKLTGQEERVLAQPAAQSAEAYEYYLRGSYASQSNDSQAADVALGLFERALQLDPDLANAYVGVGAMLLSQQGAVSDTAATREAEADFQQALRLDPRSARARRGLIHVHFRRGQDEECLKQGLEVRKLGLEDAENLLVRADAYHFGGLWDKADSLYRRVLELDPGEPGAWAFLAFNANYSGKPRECIEAGETYMQRFPEDRDVLREVADARLCLGDTARARAYYEQALAKMPERPFPYRRLAILYRQMGQPERARQLLLQGIRGVGTSLERHPDDVLARRGLAMMYAELGDRRRFLEEETRLLREAPNDASTLGALGDAHAVLGETAHALELWRAGLRTGNRYQLEPGCLHSQGLDWLGTNPDYVQFKKEFDAAGARLSALY
jgi:tetratricopeptide (TPR) repeat protein